MDALINFENVLVNNFSICARLMLVEGSTNCPTEGNRECPTTTTKLISNVKKKGRESSVFNCKFYLSITLLHLLIICCATPKSILLFIATLSMSFSVIFFPLPLTDVVCSPKYVLPGVIS